MCTAQVERGLEHRFLAIWDPGPPRRWTASQREKYIEARDAFLSRLNAAIGCTAVVLDTADPQRVQALTEAAEVVLAAKAAGVVVDHDGIHGDPALLDAWRPVLDSHSAGITALLAARPVR